MNSIRCSRRGNIARAACAFLCALPALGQSAYVNMTAPTGTVLVSAQLQLAASITNVAGTPMDSSVLAWSSSDTNVASVSPGGTVQGLFPGDALILVTDPNSGASDFMVLHVVPASLAIQRITQPFHVGDTLALSASAIGADSRAIPGVQFQFRSGQPAVARVGSNGNLFGVAEGFTTIEVRIPSVTGNAALVATTQVHVLPQPFYKIKKVLSTDVTSSTTIAAYSGVSAENAAEIGSIVTLANGNQAAVLIEGGKSKPLAVVGQALPNTGRMVVRIDAISTNTKGDVALLLEYPSQWCSAVVVLFPHGQPEQELGYANCNNGLYPRSLAENGNVLFRFNDQIYTASTVTAPSLLFSIPTQPASKDPVRNVNDFSPSRTGTFILNTSLTSGIHAYLYFDGKSLTQVYKDGDVINGRNTSNIDNPTGSSDGTFYTRVNGNNLEMLAKLAPGGVQALVTTGDALSGGGNVGWIHNVPDANAGRVLVLCDLSSGQYHTALAVWDGKLTEYATAAGYASAISGALLSNGTALASIMLKADKAIPGLRTIASSDVETVVLGTGVPFPQPVPAGIDWHYASRGGSAVAIPYRGAGDAIVNVGGAVQTLAALGTVLPNGQPATWIGAAIANESGDMVFTAGYPSGNAAVRYRSGKLETLIDTATTGAATKLNWLNNYRGRYIAMNNRGDALVSASFTTNNISYYGIMVFSSDGMHLVAQQNSSAPGGGSSYTNFQNVAIDDAGHVMFISAMSDGRTAAFYWDGKIVTRAITIGDSGPQGMTVNEISNVAGSGSGFVMMLAFGNYQIRELRSYDGLQFRTLQSTDTSLLDGTGFNYYWMNECTLSANGDAHCMAATQDGGSGVYAHRTDGRDLIVARSRDQLPGGEWLIMPLTVSSSMNGEVYFTADVYLNGVESLALYEATPQ